MVGRRASLALAALLAGGSTATADIMPPPCYYDSAAGRLVTPEHEGPDMPAVYFSVHGTDFVAWDLYTRKGDGMAVYRSVLQHCPTGRELVITYPAGARADSHDRYQQMLYGEARYSMKRIGEILARNGARVRNGAGLASGACACDFVTRTP